MSSHTEDMIASTGDNTDDMIAPTTDYVAYQRRYHRFNRRFMSPEKQIISLSYKRCDLFQEIMSVFMSKNMDKFNNL